MSSKSEILRKMYRYCAYQERCHQDVREKLKSLTVPYDLGQEIVGELIANGFLNEERFCGAYIRGKFNNNGWGKIKIMQALKEKQINGKLSEKLISKEIDPKEYQEKLIYLTKKKWPLVKESNKELKKQKVRNYLIQRGFEWELVSATVDQITGKA